MDARLTYTNSNKPPASRMRFVVLNHTALTTTRDLSHRSCIVISSLPEGDEEGERGVMVTRIRNHNVHRTDLRIVEGTARFDAGLGGLVAGVLIESGSCAVN